MRSIQLRWKTLSIMLLLFSSITTAYAQPKGDDNELQLNAGFFHTHDADSGSLSVDVAYGKYLPNPAVQLGIRQGYLGTFVDNGPDAWVATTTPFVRYHFLNLFERNTTIPYVGGAAGVVWNDQDIDGTIGPEAGVKFFMTDSTFFNANYRYEWFFTDLDIGDSRSDGNHVVSLGLGYAWQ